MMGAFFFGLVGQHTYRAHLPLRGLLPRGDLLQEVSNRKTLLPANIEPKPASSAQPLLLSVVHDGSTHRAPRRRV